MVTVKQLYNAKKDLLKYSPEYIVELCKNKDDDYMIASNIYNRTFLVEDTSILDSVVNNLVPLNANMVCTKFILNNNKILVGF